MRLAAVLVGILILTTGAAAYQVYSVTRPTPSTPTVAFSYSEYRNFSFMARVLPSLLYNSTTVSGGDVTLFTALTQWINVTWTHALSTTVPTTLTLQETVTVQIVSSAWSKVISTSHSQSSFPAAGHFGLSGAVALNLSTLSAMEQEIGNQTGVTPQSWSIEITPHLLGVVVGGGATTLVVMDAPIYFNVSQGEILPGGFNSTTAGTVLSPTGPANGGSRDTSLPAVVSYALLAASAAGLAAAAVWWSSSEKSRPGRELERLTLPYAEVIVGTRTRPRPLETIRLSRWEDLVKVADTTGRPILRVDGPGGQGTGRTFYVLDGTIGYLYEYTSAGRGPVSPPSTTSRGATGGMNSISAPPAGAGSPTAATPPGPKTGSEGESKG